MQNDIMRNYRCEPYHLYGDNSGREYGFLELRDFFSLDGTENAVCKKNLIGDPKRGEYFSFHAGDICYVERRAFHPGFVIS